jgi:hypothetical protein
MPEAARERGYEPRPRVPHSLRHSVVTGGVPYKSEIRSNVTEKETFVKDSSL